MTPIIVLIVIGLVVGAALYLRRKPAVIASNPEPQPKPPDPVVPVVPPPAPTVPVTAPVTSIGGIPAGIGSGGGVVSSPPADRALSKAEYFGAGMPGSGGFRVWFSGPGEEHESKEFPIVGTWQIYWDNGFNDMAVYLNGQPVSLGQTIVGSGPSKIRAVCLSNSHTLEHGSGPNAISFEPS